MSEVKTGYKIVSHSMVSITRNLQSGVIYKKGEFVRHTPNYGPLAVFKDIKSVKQFIHHYGWHGYPVYKVEYVPSRFVNLWYLTSAGTKIKTNSIPPGTDMAKSVKLVRKVKLKGC